MAGATAYRCVGTNGELVDWGGAEIAFQYGDGADPGAAPQFAQLVFFTSIGARDVYEQRNVATQAKQAAETDSVLKQVNDLEGDLPDVVGPTWILWGNDGAVATAGINLLHGIGTGSKSSSQRPAANSGTPASSLDTPVSVVTRTVTVNAPAPASTTRPKVSRTTQSPVLLDCKVEYFGPDNLQFEVMPSRPLSYQGKAKVTLVMRSRGITFPVEPVVQVAPTGSASNWHQVPAEDVGASAAPDSCTAAAVA
jgi:hypothetical protein